MFNALIQFIRSHYETDTFIPLHAPTINGKEREYVLETLDSTFVSSVGAYVDQFEMDIAGYTGSPAAVVTVNGTSALHMSLLLAGVLDDDYVITQALTFVATGNAISYCRATPIFLDVDKTTLGLSPQAVDAWLDEFAFIDDDGVCRHRLDQRVIRACLPMHTFGHPADLDGLVDVCKRWSIVLIEDAAEALGSLYKGKHVGTFGQLGVLSFNGNKIITTGGGGMILAHNALAQEAKHITTTAKTSHGYEYIHDVIGFNYRMPNINAAMGCAQLEQLERFIENKRALAKAYESLLANSDLTFFIEPEHCRSNYWLNTAICESREVRDLLLKETNEAQVMTRPIWEPLNQLPMFCQAPSGPLSVTQWLADRVVNLPSSVYFNE